MSKDIKQTLQDDHDQFISVISQLPEDLKADVADYADKQSLINALKNQREKYDQAMEQLRYNPDMRTVEYFLEPRVHGIAAFSSSSNTVSLAKYIHDTEEIRYCMIHELKHKDYHSSKVANLPMNLEQRYKVGIYNEMSAHLTSLVQQRQDYRMAKTDEERQKVLQRISEKDYKFYAEAIKNGQINPLSDKPDDFKKEMEFMFHGVQNMWMSRYSEFYKYQNMNAVMRAFYSHTYDELQKNDKNFNQARKAAFTIGGFNFAQFEDTDDVKCNSPAAIEADKALEANASRKVINDYLTEETKSLSPDNEPISTQIPAVRDDMSLSQQYELGLYRCVMEDIKNFKNLGGVGLTNEDIVLNSLYHDMTKYSQELMTKLMESEISPQANNRNFKKELEEICTIDGVNLLPVINKMRKEGTSLLDESMQRYEKMIKTNEKLSADERMANLQQVLFTPQKWSQNQATETERDYVIPSDDYYGEPMYQEGAEIATRSDILDLTKPVLQKELTAREMKNSLNNALIQLTAAQSDKDIMQARTAGENVGNGADTQSQTANRQDNSVKQIITKKARLQSR